MALNNSDKTDQLEGSVEDSEDDLYEQNAFSGWKKPSGGTFFLDLLSSPIIWFVVSAVAIIILLFIFLPGSSNNGSSYKGIEMKLKGWTQKLDFLEDRVINLETNLENPTDSKPSNQDNLIQEMGRFKTRLDRLEVSLNHRIDQLSGKLKNIETSSLAKKEAIPATSKKRPEPKYHTVKKGDTLYHISRMYGVSLETLRKLNNLEGNKVYPDQKIQVSR